ncbi:MAG: sulfotransferase family 2 domain-containing protein [Planctomycetaceae bacterium]
MPVSHRHRTIFTHIPKTGGTSIEAVLGMHGDRDDVGVVPYADQVADREHLYGRRLQHLSAERLREELDDDAAFSSYFKFSVVRNPWDRLVSTCAWSGRKWARREMLERAEFEAFVRRTHAAFAALRDVPGPTPLHPHVVPQVAYLFDAAGRSWMDYVGRTETLEHDWHVIRDRLGVDVDLPTRMKSVHRPYREYYDAETRALVAEIYARDIEAFGYEF